MLCALPLVWLCSGAASAASVADFTFLCTEGEACRVGGTRLVGYGSGEMRAYATLAGEFECTAQTFGIAAGSGEESCFELQFDKESWDAALNTASTADADPSALLDGAYLIVSRETARTLHLDQPTGRVSQVAFTGQLGSIWHIRTGEDGLSTLRSLTDGSLLAADDGEKVEGATLSTQMRPRLNDTWWRIERVTDDSWRIATASSRRVVDAFPARGQPVGDIFTWTYWGGRNQLWAIIPAPTAQLP